MKQNQVQEAVDAIANAVDAALLIASHEKAPDALKARLADARAGVVQYDILTHVIDVAHDADRVYADEAKALPKVKPLPKRKGVKTERPGITRKLRSALDYDCPTCKATVGSACFKFSKPGPNGTLTTERNPGFSHLARQELGRKHNDKARAQYDREHFTEASE